MWSRSRPTIRRWSVASASSGRLGVGGMGRVYAATAPDGRRAAVKVIRDDLADDTGFRQRFRREVAAASAVVGLFTARVLDADPDGEPPWLATEFVEGPSLREAVLTHGPMPERALLDLARGLAEALAAIHAAGLVHRDLKPANVLLSPGGPRVIDFGIARAVDSSRLTVTGQIIGTPDFMAPEQIEGMRESGPEGDVFALGSTLAWAATSRGPFAADQTAATLYRIMTMPPDLRGVPPRIAAIVEACLAKDPGGAADRGAARRAAAARARRCPPGRAAPRRSRCRRARRRAARLHPHRRRRRRRARVVGAGVLAAVVVAGVVGGGDAQRLRDARAGPAAHPAAQRHGGAGVRGPGQPAGPLRRPALRLGHAAVDARLHRHLPHARQRSRAAQTGLPRGRRPHDRHRAGRAPRSHRAPGRGAERRRSKTQFGLIVSEFTKARDAFTAGRAAVAAAQPLTVEAYRTGVNSYLEGTRSLAFAATVVKEIKLPPEYTAASAAAPHCKE